MEIEQQYPLDHICFYLTDGCNLNCCHCWINSQNRNADRISSTIPLDLFRSIVKQAKQLGLTKITLTGGEPLIHPYISEIIEYIHFKNIELTVETNGTTCTTELANKIAACKNSFVSVSLDGANPITHEKIRGVPGSFNAAVNGIKNLVIAGLKPQIIMTIMHDNKNQISPIIQLAEEVGAGSIKFNVLQPIARGDKMHKRGKALSINELIELGDWIENRLSKLTPLRLIFSHPVVFRSLKNIFDNNYAGVTNCGILTKLGVLSDGSYTMCGIGETVPELIYGHAGRDKLEYIWNNTATILELRNGLPQRDCKIVQQKLEGICADCLMKGACLGFCIAQNFYRTGNLWAPYWFCDEAQKRGLFPNSRIQSKIFSQNGH